MKHCPDCKAKLGTKHKPDCNIWKPTKTVRLSHCEEEKDTRPKKHLRASVTVAELQSAGKEMDKARVRYERLMDTKPIRRAYMALREARNKWVALCFLADRQSGRNVATDMIKKARKS